MPRPQFTIRILLMLMLVVAAFFGGIRFERERQRRAEEAARKREVSLKFHLKRGRIEETYDKFDSPTTIKIR